MAEYIIPGSGIVEDTATGSEIIIPGFGIYNEQEAVAAEIPIAAINYNGLKPMTFSAGRQSQCQVT